MKNYSSIAAALIDGGWTSDEAEFFQAEYNLSEADTAAIVRIMIKMEDLEEEVI